MAAICQVAETNLQMFWAHVCRSYGFMLRMFDPISRGAAIIAHSVICVRDCFSVMWTAVLVLVPAARNLVR